MPNYRRAWVPGGAFFFTLVCERRAPLFADERASRLLGSLLRRAQLRWPFTINAFVLLPDHLHAIWSLPAGDTSYPTRWGWIKIESTAPSQPTGAGQNRPADGVVQVWQPHQEGTGSQRPELNSSTSTRLATTSIRS